MAIFPKVSAGVNPNPFKAVCRETFVYTIIVYVLIFVCGGLRSADGAITRNIALCKSRPLPIDVQRCLRSKFGSYKVQEPSDLSLNARERWQAEKPLRCPGIAVGQFTNSRVPSYAILLVPRSHLDFGYKLLIFNSRIGQPSFEMRIIEHSGESKPRSLFIRAISISRCFDERSRSKFHVRTSEGILFVDAGEQEYETDIFFWANGTYKGEPIDY